MSTPGESSGQGGADNRGGKGQRRRWREGGCKEGGLVFL